LTPGRPRSNIHDTIHNQEFSMRRTLVFPLVVALSTVVLGSACASGSGGSGGSEGPSNADGVLLTKDLGRVDANFFADAMQKVLLRKYAYTLRRREEQFQNVYYETEWELRNPTPEERRQGITDTRHRVVIQGRRMGTSDVAGATQVFRLSLRAEHQVRTINLPNWHPAPSFNDALLENLRRMVSDLELEVRSGVRR